VVPMIAAFASRDSRIEKQTKLLERLSAIAAQTDRIQSAASVTKTLMQGGEFLTGANENVISADLQTRVRAMTEQAGARSRAVQALPGKTVDQIRYSGARIEILGPLQSITRTVYAIESSKPYLFIAAAALKPLPPTRQGVAE